MFETNKELVVELSQIIGGQGFTVLDSKFEGVKQKKVLTLMNSHGEG